MRSDSNDLLERVTFTGADDSVRADEILEVARRYPKTEWAILFGAGPAGAARFPSAKWLLNELPKLEGLNLSAHLCGRWMIDLVLKGDFTWLYVYEDVAKLFGRVQLNFHGQDYHPAPSFYYRISTEPYEFIFQQDDVNNHLFTKYHQLAVNGVRLFDVSHGAGVLPEEGWPIRLATEYMGYAGGLGPNNIATELVKIRAAAGPFGPFWIDMETKVRSDFDKKFDLEKVEAVCKAVWG